MSKNKIKYKYVCKSCKSKFISTYSIGCKSCGSIVDLYTLKFFNTKNNGK